MMKRSGGASPPPPSRQPSSGIDHYLNHVWWGKDSSEPAEAAAASRPEDEVAATPAASSAGSAPPSPPSPPTTTTTATRALPERERPYAGYKNKPFRNKTEAWELFNEKLAEPIVKPDVEPDVEPGEWAKRFAKNARFNNTREMAEWLLKSEDADRLPVEHKLDLASNISWSLKERTKACNASFGAPPDGCSESSKREAKALTDRLDDLAMWSHTDIVRKSNSSANSSTGPEEPEVSHQRSGLS